MDPKLSFSFSGFSISLFNCFAPSVIALQYYFSTYDSVFFDFWIFHFISLIFSF
uniref:Uncharacterized protein n=1 Tax=Manihot esculenta TaxID=3983 RepID=A0A2C9WH77_MANES